MVSVHTASLVMLLHPHSLPSFQHGVSPRDVLPKLIPQAACSSSCGALFLGNGCLQHASSQLGYHRKTVLELWPCTRASAWPLLLSLHCCTEQAGTPASIWGTVACERIYMGAWTPQWVCMCGYVQSAEGTTLKGSESLSLSRWVFEFTMSLLWVYASTNDESTCTNLQVYESLSLSLSLWICVCESLSLWIFEPLSLSLWVFESSSLWISEPLSLWVFVFESVNLSLWVFESMNLSVWVFVFESLSLWVFESLGLWIFESVSLWAWVCESVSLWVFESMKLWVFESVSLRVWIRPQRSRWGGMKWLWPWISAHCSKYTTEGTVPHG